MMKIPSVNSNFEIKLYGGFKKYGSESAKILDAIKSTSDMANFCDKWESKVILKTKKSDLPRIFDKSILAELIIKYREPSDANNAGLIGKIKNLFKKYDTIVMSDEEIDFPAAAQALRDKIWSGDMAYLLQEAVYNTSAEKNFNKKYKKNIWYVLQKEIIK